MEKEEVEANRQVIVEEEVEAIKQAANCLAEFLAFGQPLAGCRSIRLPPSNFFDLLIFSHNVICDV